MKQSIYILLLTVTGLLAGCTDLDKENPYDDQLHSLQVTAVYPDGYSEYLREGVTVKIEDVDRGNSYKAKTDKNGVAQFSLTKGIYRVQVSDKDGQDIFNGLADNVKLTSGNMAFNLPLIHSRAGAIIIKEIYCGGCTKLPLEGNYQSDKYIILHNNDSEVQYLDSLCFGKSVNVIQCSNPQCRHIVGIVDNSILSVFGQVADILEKRLDKIEKSIQSSR